MTRWTGLAMQLYRSRSHWRAVRLPSANYVLSRFTFLPHPFLPPPSPFQGHAGKDRLYYIGGKQQDISALNAAGKAMETVKNYANSIE